jgi:predicted dehydrogenase
MPTRRTFLKQSSAFVAAPFFIRTGALRDKLRIGIVGVANRGGDNLNGVAHEEIAALCDVDANYLGGAAQRFPSAKTYRDFREMIAAGGLDAVVVSTPDHTHFPASRLALERGLPVYCEKPLTHTVEQARILATLAREKKIVTQMGTQIHSGDNYRRVVERVQSGALGAITHVDVVCGKSWSGGERPTDTPPVPDSLAWDLWLGPAPKRPYHPDYHPANWRRYWAFGGGTLGDMGCHYMDLAFWALGLRHPTAVRSFGPPVHAETTPPNCIAEWTFTQGHACIASPLTFTWYDDGCRPGRLHALGLGDWGNGVLFIGTEGWLISDYDRHVAGPELVAKKVEEVKPSIPSTIGHYNEWLNAIRNGGPTTCNFEYSGALTETVLLGNVAYRVGKQLKWDAAKLDCGDQAGNRMVCGEAG